jgi:HAD superfamily phosphoserine phosphatase-like hydrolase
MALKCFQLPIEGDDLITDVHIFDLDRTLVKSNSGVLMAHYLIKRGLITRMSWLRCLFIYLLYRSKIGNMQNQMHSAFNLFFKGRLKSSICDHLDSFWKEVLSENFCESLLNHVAILKKQGKVVAIFSASPDFLVEYVAKKLEVNFVLATSYALDQVGLSFLCLNQLADGLCKARAVQDLRQKFKNATFFGYSDSWDDIDFLKAVDKPYLVRADKKLRRWAKQNDYVKVWPT